MKTPAKRISLASVRTLMHEPSGEGLLVGDFETQFDADRAMMLDFNNGDYEACYSFIGTRGRWWYMLQDEVNLLIVRSNAMAGVPSHFRRMLDKGSIGFSHSR